MESPAIYLILADGTVFEGKPFGARHETEGKVVFTTGMSGFEETLTDPGYMGQIVCQTFPLVGAPGFNGTDGESDRACLSGYIVREWCEHPSNFRCKNALDGYLKSQNVPGICGIDTRALTRHLRKNGAMGGALLTNLPADMKRLKEELTNVTSRPVPFCGAEYPRTFSAEGETKYRVMLYDLGVKKSFVQALARRGCEVICVPYDTPAEKAAAPGVDGIAWVGGPGNPAQAGDGGENLKTLLALGRPLFAAGLGHQQLANALGGAANPLPFGHHGGQPVVDTATGRTFPAAQNTGYTVDESSLPHGARVTYRNVGDGGVEGLSWEGRPLISVQFFPAGDDTAFLFDAFLAMMDKARQ